MAPTNLAFPKASLVLVTGANGYIGSHIVDQLLHLGYNVRGTVRNEKPWLNKLFEDKYGQNRFETCVVPSLDDAGAFVKAAKGASGFIHVVSLILFTESLLMLEMYTVDCSLLTKCLLRLQIHLSALILKR